MNMKPERAKQRRSVRGRPNVNLRPQVRMEKKTEKGADERGINSNARMSVPAHISRTIHCQSRASCPGIRSVGCCDWRDDRSQSRAVLCGGWRGAEGSCGVCLSADSVSKGQVTAPALAYVVHSQGSRPSAVEARIRSLPSRPAPRQPRARVCASERASKVPCAAHRRGTGARQKAAARWVAICPPCRCGRSRTAWRSFGSSCASEADDSSATTRCRMNPDGCLNRTTGARTLCGRPTTHAEGSPRKTRQSLPIPSGRGLGNVSRSTRAEGCVVGMEAIRLLAIRRGHRNACLGWRKARPSSLR